MKFSIPKDTVEGKPTLSPGLYKLRFDGVRPSLSKPKAGKVQSINFNPILKIVPTDGQPEEIRDQQIYYNMNISFNPGIVDLVHALGHVYVKDPTTGEYDIPGNFDGNPNDCTKWVYSGPLLGEVATAEITEDANVGDDGKPTGKFRNNIKQLFCRVPGCTEKHSANGKPKGSMGESDVCPTCSAEMINGKCPKCDAVTAKSPSSGLKKVQKAAYFKSKGIKA